MIASIITIGDEILIGQIVDTNSAWIGEKLNDLGVHLGKIVTVGDSKEEILMALNFLSEKSDIVLITGGLGPTKDDITVKTLAEYFSAELVFQEELYERIKHAFAIRNIPLTESHMTQCYLPHNCEILENKVGTAPGMWFEKDGTFFVSMPGVPHEMKFIMEHDVLPRLKKLNNLQEIHHRTVLTVGIGETSIAKIIENFESNLPEHVKLAYLPSLGSVRLRLTAIGKSGQKLDAILDGLVEELKKLLPKYIYGFEKEKLEEVVGRMLMNKQATLGTAESCTGGHIAHTITSIPGASNYFMGSIVSYSNKVKSSTLGVREETLEQFGAVSKETVEEMVSGCLEKISVDYAIAVSGIAGPDGGSEEKPVGLVYIGVGSRKEIKVYELKFGRQREQNIRRTTVASLNLLRKFLLDE